jgi:hypothetical protein
MVKEKHADANLVLLMFTGEGRGGDNSETPFPHYHKVSFTANPSTRAIKLETLFQQETFASYIHWKQDYRHGQQSPSSPSCGQRSSYGSDSPPALDQNRTRRS